MGGVTDWEFTYCVLREGMFRCERREYLWVSSSKEIVCCQLQTPSFSENKNTQKSHKKPESAVSCTLLMSGFQIFAADATFQNRAARDFFTHPTKKNALSFPNLCQKAWQPVRVCAYCLHDLCCPRRPASTHALNIIRARHAIENWVIQLPSGTVTRVGFKRLLQSHELYCLQTATGFAKGHLLLDSGTSTTLIYDTSMLTKTRWTKCCVPTSISSLRMDTQRS